MTWETYDDGVSTATGATVTGLTNGTEYTFRVLARNSVGDSAPSNTLAATPAGGGWTPASLPGLLGWYDASHAASFTFSSGVRVATWADLSGTGRHLAVGGGGAVGPDRTGTQNALAVCSFNNGAVASQCIEWWHSSNRYYTGAALTLVVACRVRSDLGSNPRVVAMVHQPDEDYAVAGGAIPLGIDSGKFPAGYRVNPLPGAANLAAMGTWHVHIVTFDGATCTTYMDSTTPLGTTASTGTFDFNYFLLAHGTSAWCDVQIGEVFITSAGVSGTAVADILTYTKTRWGIA